MKKKKAFPTKKQIEIYKLVHPDFEGLTVARAAEKLGINETSAYRRLDNMRKNFPEAFRFEKFEKQKVSGMHNITQIYGGYKAQAVKKGVGFTLTKDGVKELIQLECFDCGYLANSSTEVIEDENLEGLSLTCPSEHQNWAYDEETGDRFPYNHLWRYNVTKGFSYDNVITLCTNCILRRRDNARR